MRGMDDAAAAIRDRRLQQYQALLDVAESITRHGDLADLFRDLAQGLRQVVPFDFLSLLLHEAERGVMRLQFVESNRPDEVTRGPNLAPEQSPGGQAWLTQQPVVVPDYEKEVDYPGLHMVTGTVPACAPVITYR